MRTFAVYLTLFVLVFQMLLGITPPACSGGDCPEPPPTDTPVPTTKTTVPPTTQPPPSTETPRPTATEITPTSPPNYTATITPWPPDEERPTPSFAPPIITETLFPPTTPESYVYPPPDNNSYPAPKALPKTGIFDDGLSPIQLILIALILTETILAVRWARKKWKV